MAKSKNEHDSWGRPIEHLAIGVAAIYLGVLALDAIDFGFSL